MNPTLISRHGLKWNPFSPDVPTEALRVTPTLDHFGWRVEQLAREGGFALITGEPGLGKSVTLRLLAAQRDLVVGILTRPQSGVSDFYRELGDLLGESVAQALGEFVRGGGLEGEPHPDTTAERQELGGAELLGQARIAAQDHGQERTRIEGRSAQ